MTTRYLPDVHIERQATRLLNRYEREFEAVTEPPVPVEDIADGLLELGILWDSLTEAAGTSTLAGLEPHERMIKFNEAHRQVFEETPGLYNTVLDGITKSATGRCTLSITWQPNSNYLTSTKFTSASTKNPLVLKGPRKLKPIDSWLFF